MPSLMARICGICPVSHLIASAKACDALLAVAIPPTAAKLRRIMNLAQVIQSHALSFFHLVLARPAARHGFRPGTAATSFGVAAEESRAGPRRHPPAPVRPADHRACWAASAFTRLGRSRRRQRAALRSRTRDAMLATLPEALAIAPAHPRVVQGHHRKIPRRDRHLRQFPHPLHGHRQDRRRACEHYDGKLRIVDACGQRRRQTASTRPSTATIIGESGRARPT